MLLKNTRNPIRKILVLTFLLSFLIMNTNLDAKLYNTNDLVNDKNNTHIKISQTSLYEYSGVGAAQNVTEFGQGFFQNNEINVTQNGNASIIVPNNWEANEILCNVTNIYEYDKLWMNSTFDSSDLTSWTNTTTGNYDNYSYGWYNAPIGSNDSIYMTLNGSGEYWKGYDAFVNYTFYLDRDEIPYKNWEINFNFRFITSNPDWLSKLDQASKLLCRIKVGSIATQDFNLGKPSNYVNDTWYSDNIDVFTPELYDFDPPGTVNVLFGLACRGNIDLVNTGNLTTYFDNITLKLQTIPKPSQINLSITDNTNGEIKEISDLTGYGLGTVSFNNNWVGAIGGTEHKFSFSSNSSGKLYINTDIFVNATSFSFSSTELGLKGSEFCTKNETRTVWTMYFPVAIPGSYQTNYYFNVSKPTNWNVTHLFDPYGNDKISQVLETSGIGNTTLVIPNDIIVNGRWKIVAESPNYVLTTKIWKWNDTSTSWEESTNFETYDVIKINGTIDNDLISNLELTNASLLIYYPNGTEWSQAYQELSPDLSGNDEFNNFTLGALNASAGEYILTIKWNNINSSQIGFSSLNFENTHNTILGRANDQDPIVTPIYTGDTILIKVNYTDIDVGVGIFNAYLNYTIDNETAITGDMVYFGGGIYIAEIDTTGWTNGIFNVSISANKSYYKPQFQEKLIQLEVTERTTLTTPQLGGLNVPWGTNFVVDVSYNGSNNQGIPNALIDTNWDENHYTVQNIAFGDYRITCNTSIKAMGSYILKINASKPGYENQEIYISVLIRNIYTNLTFTQPTPVGYNENITFQVKYGDIDNKNLISGANIGISFDVDSNYWNSNEYFYNEVALGTYDVIFNSSRFGGSGVFQIYVTANKPNYNNATALVNVFIGDISSYLEVFLNQIDKTLDRYIELPIGAYLNITIKYIDNLTDSPLKNATIQLLGEGFDLLFNESNILEQYSIIINTDQLDIGVKFLTIYAQKTNYQPSSVVLRIVVRRINTEITTFSGESTINIKPGEIGSIKLVLNDLDFNQTIKNALVTYTSALGQGTLLDSNNDGIYETTLANVPEGTYTITISVYAGDNYEFERFELTLNVISQPEDVILFQILTILSIIAALGVGGYLVAYQKVFKYPKTVRKIHKFKKSIKKGKERPNVEILPRKELIKKLYEDNLGSLSKSIEDKNIEDKLKQ